MAGSKNATERNYIALPPEATSATTQWHDQSEVEALWMLCGAYLLFFGQVCRGAHMDVDAVTACV